MSRFDDIPDTMTSEEFLAMTKKSRVKRKGQKRVESTHVWINENHPNIIYANKQSALDNSVEDELTIHFHSQSEAKRYQVLRQKEQELIITKLELQPKFLIAQHGKAEYYYKADFSYQDHEGRFVIEEVKSHQKRPNKWYVANSAAELKMKMFESWRLVNQADWLFLLVDGNTGHYQEFYEAKFA